MKQKRYYSLILGLFVTLVICSCSDIAKALDVKLENYPSDNIYSSIKMDIFHGFNDKVSVSELKQKHGSPNQILDGKKYADIDGYDILEYKVSDGAIDCYVKKNDTIVDYIYFEPKVQSLKYSSVIKDSKIIDTIANDGAFADFIVDQFKNTVRILKTKDKKGIINVALNDNSELVGNYSLNQQIKHEKGILPVHVADLAEIIDMNIIDNTLIIDLLVHESKQRVVKTLFNDNRLSDAIGMILFDNMGLYCYITPSIINEKTKVIFHFIGEQTKQELNREFSIGRTLTLPTTNMRMLNARIIFSNLGTSPIVAEGLKDIVPCPIFIKSNNLVVSNIIKGNVLKNWSDVNADNFGDYALGWISDLNNPDWIMTLLAYKCGLGLEYSIIMGDYSNRLKINLTNKQLFKLISMSVERSNED